MPQRNIANSKQTRPPSIALFLHRLPNLGIRIRPVVPRRRPVQHIAVNVISPKMFERTSHRLRDLNRKACRRIVGQPMILPRPVSEFRLQKNIRAGDYTRAISCRQSVTNSGLKIMPPLVRRVDAPKPRAQRRFH